LKEQKMTNKIDLTPLLQPRSIAIIGASENQERIGGWPIKLLRDAGFEKIYPINPKYERLGELPCFPRIEDISDPIDLVIIATPARDVLGQLEQAHRKGVRAAIIFAAGFAEIKDGSGVELQAALTAFADRTGMAIAGPNSIGLVNWAKGVFATFARAFQPAAPLGKTALIGQSGNISSAIYRTAIKTNLDFSYAISAGNEACLNISDYLGYLAEDPDTNAALCYVETLRDGPGFMAAARRFRAQGKLLAIFKTGASDKGAEAARAHTAAVVGNRIAYETAFEACGVARAEDVAHLAELAYMHRFSHRSVGPNVAVVSVSGAACAIYSDALTARNMTIPTLPDSVQAKLQKFIPPYGNTANPVDLTGNVSNDVGTVSAVLEAVLMAETTDVLLLYVGGKVLGAALPTLAKFSQTTDKLIVVVDIGQTGMRAEVEALGIAFFDEISPSVRALSTYAAWKLAPITPPLPVGRSSPEVVAEFRKAKGPGHPAQLGELASQLIFAAGGIEAPRGAITLTEESAVENAERIGYPVALKLVSPDVLHKTGIGGVRLNLNSAVAVEGAFREINASVSLAAPDAANEGISVEPSGVHELVVSAQRDPVFGWMMTVGAGGVWAELFNDVSHALLPVDERQAAIMLQRLKSFPLLRGFRGSPPGDLDAACRAIASLSKIVLSLDDEILGCEINPLIVLATDRGAVAANALITLPPAPVQA
jgi:acyl-CoA synthetase (NDP forming)